MRVTFLSLVVAAGLTACAYGQASLSALTSFGGGDGWRAPNEVLVGDSAGTTGTPTVGAYNYLQTANLERGLAYNPVTGNLILVSRSTAGNGIRVLSGSTGADVGFLNQGTGVISGGTFTTNMVAVGDDGQIYVANLQSNVNTANLRIYKWATEGAAAPTVHYSGTVPGFTPAAPRLGDSMDATGSGANTKIALGLNGGIGYAVIEGSTPTATAVNAFSPTGPISGDFRLGITFADTSSAVWGKVTSGTLRRTTYTVGVATGTSVGPTTLTSAGEMAMDYAVIGGVPYLATLDANTSGTIDSSLVRIYDVTNPALPLLVASAENTSGALVGNTNATGSIKWGAISGTNATLYSLSSNQGIQAFRFAAVPEASSFLAVGAVGMLFAAVRRFRRS